jgi:hypothetical protein
LTIFFGDLNFDDLNFGDLGFGDLGFGDLESRAENLKSNSGLSEEKHGSR